MKCIIVDDDSMARKALEKCVVETSYLELVGICASAFEAIDLIKAQPVDLIFLDIEMPVLSGIDFIKTFKDIPQIILVTSKKEYAVEAYENDVTDYIVKPFKYARFLQAVEKAQRIHESFDKQQGEPDFIFFKVDSKMVRVNLKDIQYIEALGDYVLIYTTTGRHTVLSTMKAMETKLGDSQFMRVHKSFIVRMDEVSQYDSSSLKIGTKSIPVSRTYKEALANRFSS